MGAIPFEAEMLGLKIVSKQLPFAASQELLPEAIRFVAQASTVAAAAFAALGGKKLDDITPNDIVRLLPKLKPDEISELVAMLTKHHRKLLATTCVIMPDETGEKANFELAKEKDRETVFNERPDAFIPICLIAGKVTFARFFPGTGLRAGGTPSASS